MSLENLGDAAAGLSPDCSPQDEFPRMDYLQRVGSTGSESTLGLLAGEPAAAIDISDGLYADLEKLLTASGVGADIRSRQSAAARRVTEPVSTAEQQRQFAMCGGDDYELCFTSSKPLPDEIEGVAIDRDRRSHKRPGIVCRDGGEVVPFTDSGYRHFQ